MTDNRELELYFHIPFCVRKCLYCDFLSAPAESRVKNQYMEALTREVRERAETCRDYRVVSAFLGGGTPSVVETDQIIRLLQTVRECYNIASEIELTIEVNPGTVDRKKLENYRKAGVNRLSIGLQSAQDCELASLGRIHTWQQFLEVYREAREVGFANINVDIMSALPGQSLESYRQTLEKVLALKPIPEHISAYSLILEEGTELFERAARGELQLPEEETDRLIYQETGRLLARAGFERYEISNYARAGFQCEHNRGYWKRRDYLGFGIGAASLLNNMRFKNGSNLKRYLENPLNCREDVQQLSIEEQMEEFMFLGLRLTKGVSASEFECYFGRSLESVYGEVIARKEREGLLHWYYRREGVGESDKMLALTERGLDVSNYVMQDFLL